MDDLIFKKINDPLLKAIVSYRDHPSIAAIKKICNLDHTFYLKMLNKKEIMKELNNLNINKATQNTDIPIKIIMENPDIFGDFLFSNLKMAGLIPDYIHIC